MKAQLILKHEDTSLPVGKQPLPLISQKPLPQAPGSCLQSAEGPSGQGRGSPGSCCRHGKPWSRSRLRPSAHSTVPPERGCPDPHATPTHSVWLLPLSTSKLFCLNYAVCSTFQGTSVIPLRQKASHDILCFFDYCFILNTAPGRWRYRRNVLQPETLTLTCPQILPRPRRVWRLREPSLDSPPPGAQLVLISLESRHAATAHPTPHLRS